MFQKFFKSDTNRSIFQSNNKQEEMSQQDKNFKFMLLSASILVGLFIYTTIRSDSVIQNGSYMLGIGFLLFLMVLSFYLNRYKEKIRGYIPPNRFEAQMEKTTTMPQKEESVREASMIEPIVSSIGFDAVAGIEPIKGELEEIVDFLHNPTKYTIHGALLPKGVLLVGPPGVGKTLIARAVAGEADVPFFYQSGASFVHIYVGMGAKRVRELFMRAKSMAPAIIFIDEIDAIGKKRNGGSNDEREATLNELLTQMDGFDGQNGVIVIGATNKIEVLDEALLRSGRFDRRIFLGLPALEDRVKILYLYLRGKNHRIDIEKLASSTSGFSSAALATLVNEAILMMVKEEKSILDEVTIEAAKHKVQYGKKQLMILSDEQKEILALYQASKGFILQKKVALFDEGIGEVASDYQSRSALLATIKGYLAGGVGVEIFKKEPYAIYPNDRARGYEIAREMVDIYGMGESAEAIIQEIRGELIEELSLQGGHILALTQKMIKDEVLLF